MPHASYIVYCDGPDSPHAFDIVPLQPRKGKAHARQIDADTRHGWASVLDADRLGAFNAPNWLRKSVVSLAGSHEAGYLDHWRHYAMKG